MAWSTQGRLLFSVAAAVLMLTGVAVFAADEASAAPDDCFEQTPRADVGIVFDESGSMDGEKIEAAKQGGLALTDALTDDQYSGLVSFDDDVYLRKEVGPNHDATASEIESLTAGGSTATGDGIDKSHDDLLANGLDAGRDIMVVLADGKTNTGSDPIQQADEAKADGIEIFTIAFGDGADENELKEVASEPTEDYFFDASEDNIENVFLQITQNVTSRNDTQAPSASVPAPQEGHLYLDGQDQGPNTTLADGRATIVGQMPFELSIQENCYLENVEADVPGTGFHHEENATQITTPPFDARAAGPGNYTLQVEALDWVGLNDTATVDLHIPEIGEESRVLGLWAGTSTPENAEYRTGGVQIVDVGQDDRRTAEIDQPGLAWARGLHENGSVDMVLDQRTATGETRISELELFDGLVTARNLVHRATVAADFDGSSGRIVDQLYRIGHLEVAGEPVDVDHQAGPVTVPLPGDGYLELFPRQVDASGYGVQYRSQLVHAHAPDAYGGGEVVLGDVFLEIGGDDEPKPQAREIARQDDADADRDASQSDPVAVGSGLYDGTFTPTDTADVYQLAAEHGDKIKINIEPSSKARFTGGTVEILDGEANATEPGARTVLPLTRAHLFDPQGDLRARTIFADGSPAPQSVEINADQAGNWTLVVERTDAFTQGTRTDPDYAHYSFDLTVTDHPLLPQRDALSASDAPATCEAPDAEIPEIADGQWPGVLKQDDRNDVYRFHADIGDLVTATLKPGETADGAAMDLYLYGEDCDELLDSSSLGGEKSLKGVPEATVELPTDYTGTHYLRIERVNGVGNHHVTLSVRDPHPSTPTGDAFTGQDAASDPANASQAPPGAFQGGLSEDDAGDAYALPMTAGAETWVGVETSALSSFRVSLYEPDGDRIYSSVEPKPNTHLWSFVPGETGDHTLLVEPTVTGGGNYTVTWGQASVSLLGPLPLQSGGLPGASTSP